MLGFEVSFTGCEPECVLGQLDAISAAHADFGLVRVILGNPLSFKYEPHCTKVENLLATILVERLISYGYNATFREI